MKCENCGHNHCDSGECYVCDCKQFIPNNSHSNASFDEDPDVSHYSRENKQSGSDIPLSDKYLYNFRFSKLKYEKLFWESDVAEAVRKLKDLVATTLHEDINKIFGDFK